MLMNNILRPFMGKFVVDFINDVLVYGKNMHYLIFVFKHCVKQVFCKQGKYVVLFD